MPSLILPSVLLAAFALSAPAVAGDGAAAASSLADVATLITALGGIIPAVGAAIVATRRARSAEVVAAQSQQQAADAQRRAAAIEQAVRHHNAHNEGILLILVYPSAEMDARRLLEIWGFKTCVYVMQPGELFPSTPEFQRDLASADCVLLQGLTISEHERLFRTREFTDRTAQGVSRICLVPREGTFYKQGLTATTDMSCTTAIAAEFWVRNAMANREQARRFQGIRPGGVAEARAQLVG